MSKILCPQGGNDRVYTPDALASKIVDFFNPSGLVLEPCKGGGAFLRALNRPGIETAWCELEEDKNFFEWGQRVDWIITNPPWSKFRCFLNHSFTVTDKLVFLVTLNHFQTKARIRDMESAGFWPTKVLLLDTPKEFPQSGFQLCAALVERTKSKSTLFCR